MTQNVIYGLPGMYQNWLSAALDPACEWRQQGQNFLAYNSEFPWTAKIEIVDPPPAKRVINMCVGYHNLVWYLHNYLEKTDDIGLRTNYLVEDLCALGPNTKAFGDLFAHWFNAYNIEQNPDKDYLANSLIEYFYHWLVQKHEWQQKLLWRHPDKHAINLEYSAFNSLDTLHRLLDGVIKDQTHFDNMYVLLRDANGHYLDQSEKFYTKLKLIKNINNFTILEQSYIGSLMHSTIDMGTAVLDWFNPDVRNRLWRRNHSFVVGTHREYMLQYKTYDYHRQTHSTQFYERG